jgi:hypothetical protein
MAQWEIGQRIWQWYTGSAWSTADTSIPRYSALTFRGGFTIVNGDEAINTGDLMVQRFVGGSWVDWSSYYGKFVRPGYTIGINVYLPQYVVWGIAFYHDGALRTRLKITWDGGEYFSSEIVITTTTVTEIWTEDEPVAATFTEDEPVAATFTEAEAVAATFTESEAVAATFTESEGVAASWTEDEPVAATFTEAAPVAATFTEDKAVAATFTEAAPVAATFTEAKPVAATFTEDTTAVTTWTEDSA